jgi:hypothetical protein
MQAVPVPETFIDTINGARIKAALKPRSSADQFIESFSMPDRPC